MVNSTMLAGKQPDVFITDEDFCDYAKTLTGYAYRFVNTSIRYWNGSAEFGVFYTLAPVTHDDGFYEWYNFTCPSQQAFRDKTEALLRFMFQWMVWDKTKGQNLFK